MNNDNHRAMSGWQDGLSEPIRLLMCVLEDNERNGKVMPEVIEEIKAHVYATNPVLAEQPGGSMQGEVEPVELPEFLRRVAADPYAAVAVKNATTQPDVREEERKPMIRFRHGDPFTGKLNILQSAAPAAPLPLAYATEKVANELGIPVGTALWDSPAAPGFDDIAVHCQQAGCQFLNPLPESVRVDDAMVERALFAFYRDPQADAVGWHNLLKENAMVGLVSRMRGAMREALAAALATDVGKEESNGK